MAAGPEVSFVQLSTLDRLLTSTHCDRCVRDGGRIAGRASGDGAVVDCVTEVGNAAQAVEVHSRAVERARIVQGCGVTLFLSGRQPCPAPQGARQPVRLTPQGSRLSMDWALASAASESRATDRIPNMMPVLSDGDRNDGKNE